MMISKITPTLNYPQSNIPKNSKVSFGNISEVPVEPKSKFFEPLEKFFKPLTNGYKAFMDELTTPLSKTLGKILQSDGFTKILARTKGTNMIKHITAFTSLVLSAFYVKQTLENEELEKAKRTTLAINQGIVAIVSLVSGYVIDNKLAKLVDKFIDRFTAVNLTKAKIGKYVDGIKCAQSIIVFGTVYRFVAPVLITPIANMIGNKVNAKKTSETAIKAQIKN